MNRKSVQAQSVKLNDEEGSFEAVFATLNVRDKDGDVIVPGAIENGSPVRISAYNHSSWGGALPVGKGTITEENDELVVRGKFFQTTEAGQETYKTVKELDDLTEWSFGFDTVESENGELDGKRVQFLRKMKVYEVSPVLLGAGINTRTTAIKSSIDLSDFTDDQIADAVVSIGDYHYSFDPYKWAITTGSSTETQKQATEEKEGDEPQDADRQSDQGEENEKGATTHGGFKAHILTVQESVKDVAERSQEIKRLRTEDGRDFGPERKEDLRQLVAEMRKAATVIEAVIEDSEGEGVVLLAKIRDQLMEADHER